MRTEDGYIISKCLNGDHDAFGLLVDKYKAGVYALAYSKLGNFHDAEDVAQEVFIKAYEKLHTLRQWDRFTSWLYRITINLCNTWLRDHSKFSELEYLGDSSKAMDSHAIESYHEERKLESIHEALNSLSEVHREAVMLHYFGGMTSFEIAQFSGVSPSAIRRRLMRARSLLKEELLSTIAVAFDAKKLQAGFTLQVLERTRHTKPRPPLRDKFIPWGTSIASALIAMVLVMGTPMSQLLPADICAVIGMSNQTAPIGKGEITAFVLDDATIESGGGESMLSGSKITKFVATIATLAVLSGNAVGQTEWTKYDFNGDGRPDPVLEQGPGDWEAHRIGYPRVIFDDGLYKMYYTGQTEGNTSRFGYATSIDGIHWDKYVDESSNHVPIMYPGGSWDRHNIHVPAVILDSNEIDSSKRYKMWYQGDDWTFYRIGYATSADGIHWDNRQLVLPSSGEPGYASTGNVIIDEGKYVMYYGFQPSPVPTTVWRATSMDGIQWSNRQQVLSFGESGEWDDREAQNPYVEKYAGLYHMWYCGHRTGMAGNIGYATSVNGIDWLKSPNNPILSSTGNPGDPDETQVHSPSVIIENSKIRMWYHGGSNTSSYWGPILYATDEIPIAENDSIECDMDVPYTFDVLINDRDLDDVDPDTGEKNLCIIMVKLPKYGTLADETGILQPDDPNDPERRKLLNFYNGTLTYTATDSSQSVDSFEYVVSDYKGGASVGLVTIKINHKPFADAGVSYDGNEGLPITFDGSASYDPDGDSLQYKWSFDDGVNWTDLSTDPTASHTWDDDWSGTAKLEVTDGKLNDTDTASVTINNVPPSVDAGPDVTINEGETFTGLGSFTDPGADTWTATVNYGDNTGNQALALNPDKSFDLSHQYPQDGTFIVKVEITDDDNGYGDDELTVTVNNVIPTVTILASNATISEGDVWTATGSFTDPGADAWTATVDYGDGSDIMPLTLTDKTFDLSHGYLDNPESPEPPYYTVVVYVHDGKDTGISNQVQIIVKNVAPSVADITASVDPVLIGDAIAVSADFTDPGERDTHTASWDWGDESPSDGIVTETNGSGSVAGNHTYASAGVYTITLTVTDKDDDSGTSMFQYVVIYDPEGGFVTGGGWIDSPAEAYTYDPTLTGKATFGFVSKYKKGATVPTGNTQFNFHVADMKFSSTEYEWLVIAGAKAKYKGTGTINGEGDYKFMLTAIDGEIKGDDIDRFRIKITDKADDRLVYDNLMDAPDDADPTTAISGGSIVIHGDKDKVKAAPAMVSDPPASTQLLTAYPNPANPEVWIPYQLSGDTDVTVRIYSISGQLVRTLSLGHRQAGLHASKSKSAYWDGKNESGESIRSGIYFYNIKAGEFTATGKMLIQK